MEKITKSSSTEHHYSDREKQEALKDYTESIALEIDRMYTLYDRYLEQVNHKSFKSEQYDFELHNELSFEIEQIKRIVKHKTEHVRTNYDAQVEDIDFDILLENYQANK